MADETTPAEPPPAPLRWWCYHHGSLTVYQTRRIEHPDGTTTRECARRIPLGDLVYDHCGRIVFAWTQAEPIPTPISVRP